VSAEAQDPGSEREAAVQRAIEAAFRAVADALEAYSMVHRSIAKERPTVSLGGNGLDVAVWELMGRCLSLANALLLLLRHGYVVQSDVLLRALWETNSVLATISAPEEQELRKRWLEGKNIPYSATARAMERLERRFKEETGALPPGEPMRTSWESLYRLLSAGSHGLRSSISSSKLSSGFAYSDESAQVDKAMAAFVSTGLLFLITLSFDRALSYALGPDWTPDATASKCSNELLRSLGSIATAAIASDEDLEKAVDAQTSD
jgi:hypothetical protein